MLFKKKKKKKQEQTDTPIYYLIHFDIKVLTISYTVVSNINNCNFYIL